MKIGDTILITASESKWFNCMGKIESIFTLQSGYQFMRTRMPDGGLYTYGTANVKLSKAKIKVKSVKLCKPWSI